LKRRPCCLSYTQVLEAARFGHEKRGIEGSEPDRAKNDTAAQFKAKIRRPTMPGDDPSWGFIILSKEASAKLPRRGRTTVEGTLNSHRFTATLEPDGQLSHWFRVNNELLENADVAIGDTVTLKISPVAQEPEPDVPPDLQQAVSASPAAQAAWEETPTIARVDWIHWATTAKQAATRAKRISNACDMLASGKKRVCCFDPSGYYSKAFGAPEEAD
jgi:hypothetical protein